MSTRSGASAAATENGRRLDGAAPRTRPAAGKRWLVLGAFVVLLVAAALPVLSVKLPGMMDYPNHLGRMYAIDNIGRDPLLAQYYTVDWRLIPNLAMDSVVPVIARYSDIFVAGRIFVLAAMLLMLSGPFAIEAALFGAVSVWPLVGFVFIYNWIFFYGFVNYLFGIGVALWGIAAWIALRERGAPLRLAAALAFTLLLFTIHLDAVAIYGLTIFCYELWRLRQQGVPQGRGAAVQAAVFLLPFLVVLALAARSPTAGSSVLFSNWMLRTKVEGLVFVVQTFAKPLDLAVGALTVVAATWALLTRRLALHGAAPYVFAGFAAVFIALPWRVLGSFQADSRLPIAAVFILIGMARLRLRDSRAAVGVAAGIAAVALLRFAVVALAWQDFAIDVADVERSFAEIRPGSRILTTQEATPDVAGASALLYDHLPALALAERSSFVALAFTDPGKQVLLTRPAVRDIAAYEGIPPRIDKVVAGTPDIAATPPDAGDVAYYRDWRRRFDYLYVLFAHGAPPAPELSLVYQGRHFQLYEVRHPARGG